MKGGLAVVQSFAQSTATSYCFATPLLSCQLSCQRRRTYVTSESQRWGSGRPHPIKASSGIKIRPKKRPKKRSKESKRRNSQLTPVVSTGEMSMFNFGTCPTMSYAATLPNSPRWTLDEAFQRSLQHQLTLVI